VIERAAISKFAFSGFLHVSARLSFVVGMDSAEGSLAKLLWKRVIWLSKLLWSVSELAVLAKWAFSICLEVLAHLGLEFLLQGIELALSTVEIVIVARLLKMSHDLSWWVVEISFLSVWS
jgi:hypothetical protein